MKAKEMNEVHCLICDDVYEEHETFIEACPHCGNKNTELTVYLMPEKENNNES